MRYSIVIRDYEADVHNDEVVRIGPLSVAFDAALNQANRSLKDYLTDINDLREDYGEINDETKESSITYWSDDFHCYFDSVEDWRRLVLEQVTVSIELEIN